MHIDRRLLGWGVFFILLGAIPLAVRAGYLSETQVEGWPSLWPILLIGWGLGLLLRRTPVEWIGGAVGAVVLGVMAGGALATGFGGVSMFGGCGDGQGTAFTTQRGTLTGGGQVNVDFSCGTLAIEGADGSDWSVAGTDRGGRGPRIDVSGSAVSIETPAGSFWENTGGQNNWTVGVPRASQVGLGMTLNAGRGSADLTGANITSASLTVNAGDFRLDLADAAQLGDVNATVNAGQAIVSLPGGDRSANMSLNAGNLEVCVPAGTAIRVGWSGALGSNDLDETGLTETGDNVWVTAGFSETAPHLELRVSANAGSFDLTIGEVCGA
jgi:hypothetical protein